jgi:hypothetical protein
VINIILSFWSAIASAAVGVAMLHSPKGLLFENVLLVWILVVSSVIILTRNVANFTGCTWGERFIDPGGLARKGSRIPKGSTSTSPTHWKFYGIVDSVL